ncbi:MAG: redoxin domain-containing protein [Haloarculaceae archaeon]
MVDVGDTAPDFTAPIANGDVGETFTLSERVEEEAPVVLAFYPGAFTSVCTGEMNELDSRLAAFQDAGATVYGVSVDSPFAQNEFRSQESLGFDMLSDIDKSVIDAYDVGMDFDALGINGVAKRAVFVVDENCEVTYAWVTDDPGVEPDYDELEEAAASA